MKSIFTGVLLAAAYVTCTVAAILIADMIRMQAAPMHAPAPPPPRAGHWDPFKNYLREA